MADAPDALSAEEMSALAEVLGEEGADGGPGGRGGASRDADGTEVDADVLSAILWEDGTHEGRHDSNAEADSGRSPRAAGAPLAPATDADGADLRRAVLIKEYGVMRVRGAMSEDQQQDVWQLTTPYVADPAGGATGFSNFQVSAKNGKAKRVPEFDACGARLFSLAAAELAKQISEDECRDEPSFKHLFDIASGEETMNQDQIAGYYYRPDAHLMNHRDSDQILFTMSVALGDDCDFVIGKTTSRSARMSERSGKEFNIRIKSGDALFFDGGLVPHQVERVSKNNVIAGTAPRWWFVDGELVPH